MEQVGQRKIDGLWLIVVGIAVLFFLILPTLIVIPMSFSGASFLEFPPTSFSFRWYAAYFTSPEWMSATKTSLIAAVMTTAIALETSKGDLALALALGSVLVLVVLAVNAAAHAIKVYGARQHG